MDTDSIDASIGLEFSLELFKAYRASGTLQALFRRVPGIQKNSLASLQLIEGAVVACFIEERGGQRLPVTKATLIQYDNERGPFEWKFRRSVQVSPPLSVTPVPPSASFAQSATTHPSQQSPYAVPRIAARLNWIQLRTWSYEQREAVYLVWQLIDGKRTVQDIQITLGNQLPTTKVNEVLQILLDMNVITVQ